MELKKRILSAAILLTVLGAGLGYTAKHTYFPKNEVVEDTLDEEKTLQDIIDENEHDASAFLVYNEALVDASTKMSTADIAYLSTLRDNQSIAALSSTIGHYNTIDLDSDDALVVTEPGQKPRVAERAAVENDYYYDILTGIYASDILTEEAMGNAMPFGEFVEKNDLEPSGYCLPTFGKCEASDEALKTIEEMFGKEVADVVREYGLPVPFYSYQAIYDPYMYDVHPVKGLNN